FQFLECSPPRVTLTPIEAGRKPDCERLREIFIGVTLCVPVFEMRDIAAAERTGPVTVRCFLTRSLPEKLLPFFLSGKSIRVHVSVTRFMAHQFHEPFGRLSLDLEHHRPLQCAQSIVHEKKRNENGWD